MTAEGATPAEQIRAQWQRLSAAERKEFLAWAPTAGMEDLRRLWGELSPEDRWAFLAWAEAQAPKKRGRK